VNNTFCFLRHAVPKLDKSKPRSKWILSEEGVHAAQKLAPSPVFDNVNLIISSEEERAYQTARFVADKLGKEVVRMLELNELEQDAGGFLEKEEFDRTIRFALTRWDRSLHGWETARCALDRFRKAVNQVNSEYEGKTILIVSHGCVLNLYFAELLNKLNTVYERWNKTTFLNYGLVKDGKVVKDIVEESEPRVSP